MTPRYFGMAQLKREGRPVEFDQASPRAKYIDMVRRSAALEGKADAAEDEFRQWFSIQIGLATSHAVKTERLRARRARAKEKKRKHK